MELMDFSENERLTGRAYGGNGGIKRAYLHDGVVWMVKFPPSKGDSWASAPLNEYIGSHIYATLGIPVHDTLLGRCQGKIVVGCRDFAVDAELLDFHGIKNTVDESLISGSFGSSSRGERLTDVLRIIDDAEDFAFIRSEAVKRFWDMFVTDAFILNDSRDNGNWGLLATRYTVKLVPVFDNGDGFCGKKRAFSVEESLRNEDMAERYMRTAISFFTDDFDEHIHPFSYIASMENEDCNAAVLRFAEHLDMDKVRSVIEEIPEQAFGLTVTSPAQKKLYVKLLETAYEKGIRPVAEKLWERGCVADLARECKAMEIASRNNDLSRTLDKGRMDKGL